MSTVAEKTHYTPEDLLRLPDGDRYELVDGQLVEHAMSAWSSYVTGRVFSRLNDHSPAGRLGWVFPESVSYQCFPDSPGKVRRADVSFICFDRLPVEQARAEGHLHIAPDLAVEVVSPNDLAYDVDEKVEEYLRAGVRLVWVVNPETRVVKVYRADGTGTLVREQGELDGEDVVPGFRCRVSDLFALPPGGTGSSPA